MGQGKNSLTGNGKVEKEIGEKTEHMIQGQSLTTSHARLMPHQPPSNR